MGGLAGESSRGGSWEVKGVKSTFHPTQRQPGGHSWATLHMALFSRVGARVSAI